jgi:hypothetical protein
MFQLEIEEESEEDEEEDEEVTSVTALVEEQEEKHRRRRIEEKKRDEQNRKHEEGKGHTFLLNGVTIPFEGVDYSCIHDTERDIWIVEDIGGSFSGEWINTDSDSWIYWNDDCWEEQHKEHEDYNGEE